MLAQIPRTRWGGIADGKFRPSGYFRITARNGIFWLVDPDGGRFLSKGINSVRFDQDRIQNTDRIPYAQACQRKYGNEETWRAAAARRLAGWGFNTLGSWSDEAVAKAGGAQLVLTPILDLAWAENNSAGSRTSQDFPDVFDADFDRHVRRRAQMLCGPRRNDPAIVGWFIDNELRWGPDWRGDEELLTIFIRLPPDCPGRVAAVNWLRERHPDFQQFNAIWRTPAASWDAFALLARAEPPYRRKPPYHRSAREEEEGANRADPSRAAFTADCDAFAALVAERYFALTCAAVRAADPHCMSSEHFGQFAWQFERMSGSSGLKVQAAIAC